MHTYTYAYLYICIPTHSPNFKGAAEAAERLASIPEFKNAQVVKCNPDTPQSMVKIHTHVWSDLDSFVWWAAQARAGLSGM